MKNLIILLLVCSSYFTFSQDKYNGFLGKKNFIDVTSVTYVPLLHILFGQENNQGYKAEGNTLTKKNMAWLNSGFRVSVGRAYKRNFGMSLEAGMDFYEVILENDYSFYNNYYTGSEIIIRRHENIDVRVLTIMPKLHFANSSSLLPLGLSHEVGIGVCMSSIADKDYLSEFYGGQSFGNLELIESPEPSDYLDFDASFRSLQLLYGIKMRTPLSKSLFLNYGFRYTAEIKIGDNYSKASKVGFIDITDEVMSNYNKRLLYNVASFDLGLSFVF